MTTRPLHVDRARCEHAIAWISYRQRRAIVIKHQECRLCGLVWDELLPTRRRLDPSPPPAPHAGTPTPR